MGTRGTRTRCDGWAIPAVALACATGMVACADGPDTADAQAVAQPSQQGQEQVTMDSVSVLRVTLEEPISVVDASGEERRWEQAFLVRLAMAPPPAEGPTFDIFLGEERVPEFGGWEAGIYFWIYDPVRLQAVDGRAISYRFDRGPLVQLGSLEIGDPGALPQVAESALRGGR